MATEIDHVSLPRDSKILDSSEENHHQLHHLTTPDIHIYTYTQSIIRLYCFSFSDSQEFSRFPSMATFTIDEDEYDLDPPPAYNTIGPAPISFRDCIASSPQTRNHRSRHSSHYVVRDTQRMRSFGIGGAGNIREFFLPFPPVFSPTQPHLTDQEQPRSRSLQPGQHRFWSQEAPS